MQQNLIPSYDKQVRTIDDTVWGSIFLTLTDKIINKGFKKKNTNEDEYQVGLVKTSLF